MGAEEKHKDTCKLTDEQLDMFNNNTRLVTYCIKRYIKMGYIDDFDDLFQEGCIGLMEAVQRFNPDAGYQFSTFAISYILGYIRKYRTFNILHGVKVGTASRDIIPKISRLISEDPTLNTYEIADKLELSVEQVEKSLIYSDSIDRRIDASDSYTTFGDILGDKNVDVENDAISNEQTQYILEKLRSSLGAMELSILDDMLEAYNRGKKITQHELADKYNTSQASISRITILIKDRLQRILDKEERKLGI